MSENKTQPTKVKVRDFLRTVSAQRQEEAKILIEMMVEISGKTAVMWGPSIIGFGSKHYQYDSGREGDMPELGFSPRKAAINIYFSEGFNVYSTELSKLGRYKNSVSCLYISKLTDIDLGVLRLMLERSYEMTNNEPVKPKIVNEYVYHVPTAA